MKAFSFHYVSLRTHKFSPGLLFFLPFLKNNIQPFAIIDFNSELQLIWFHIFCCVSLCLLTSKSWQRLLAVSQSDRSSSDQWQSPYTDSLCVLCSSSGMTTKMKTKTSFTSKMTWSRSCSCNHSVHVMLRSSPFTFTVYVFLASHSSLMTAAFEAHLGEVSSSCTEEAFISCLLLSLTAIHILSVQFG